MKAPLIRTAIACICTHAALLLGELRAARPRTPTATPVGVTDLRLYRVFTGDARVGLQLRP